MCRVWLAAHDAAARGVQKNKEAEEYAQLLAQRKQEVRERRSESLAKKRAARMASQASQQ